MRIKLKRWLIHMPLKLRWIHQSVMPIFISVMPRLYSQNIYSLFSWFSKYLDFNLVILDFFIVPLKRKLILAWLTETFYGKKIGWSIILMRVSEIKRPSQKYSSVFTHALMLYSKSDPHKLIKHRPVIFFIFPLKVTECMKQLINRLTIFWQF